MESKTLPFVIFLICFLTIFFSSMLYQRKRIDTLKNIIRFNFSEFKPSEIIVSTIFALIIAALLVLSLRT